MADVLPKKNYTDNNPIKVHLAFLITQIYDIQSDQEKADLGVWVSMKWKNQLISWNASEYNVNYLEVPSNYIWSPKMYIKQTAETKMLRPDSHSSMVIVLPDGSMQLEFGTRLKLSCAMPACLFPIDSHKCPLTILSTAHPSKNVLLVPDPESQKRYEPFSKNSTGLWSLKVEDFKAADNVFMLLDNKPMPSSLLHTNINLKRKSTYYWLTIIAPITLLYLITFGAVLLPRQGGERSTLLVTVMLAQIVFLDTVLKNVPKTSDYIPIIVSFLAVVLVFTVFQISLTAVVSYYAELACKSKKMSKCHGRFIDLVSKIFMCNKKANKNKNKVGQTQELDEQENGLKQKASLDLYDHDEDHDSPSSPPASTTTTTTNVASVKEDNTSCERDKEKDELDKRRNAYKAMCNAMERFSISISMTFFILSPVIFVLIYTGVLKYECAVQ
eukprot:gene15877-17477_t